jgi:AraC family transcriptional regulator of adaptative response/methylated-DNA-[protein]-cysteine methyltransferase
MLMTPSNRLDESKAWTAVLSRDAGADGTLVYAVRTTGIYCRPSCPSRRPGRLNVTFFADAATAERAGFRACKRCQPNMAVQAGDAAVQRAMSFIDDHFSDIGDERITLEVLGKHAGLSPYHLQRKFKATVGLTPAEYLRARKSAKLREELKQGTSVSRATFDAGFGSSSQVYGGGSRGLGMTPGVYRRGGKGMEIEYVIARTSLGPLLVGATANGVCSVTLGDDIPALEEMLAEEFPAAKRKRVSAPSSSLGVWLADIVASVDGERAQTNVPLDVQASAFQWKVWRELQKIPFGETRSYTDIANAIGSPKAARAVASACANNRVALLVPCHRVIRTGGSLGGYRWGLDRKRTLLQREKAARERSSS